MAQVWDFVKHYFWGGKQMQYKGEGVSLGVEFFRLARQLDSRGMWVREQVLVFCSHGVKVRKQVYVRRCGDTFHPPEKWTLYLKVTPFDSKTPTHFNTKVPIGGYVLRSSTA